MQRLNINPKRGQIRQSALSGRINALLRIFSDGKPHKAAYLAQQIGVNSRTIRRTLHLMRDEMGIPMLAGRDGFQLQNLDEIATALSSTDRNITPPTRDESTQFWTRSTAVAQHN